MEVITERAKESTEGKIVNTELGHFPYDWQNTTLEELCSFITKGSTPTTYGFDWQSSGVKFLRSECVSEFGLDLEPAMYISDEANQLLRRSQVQSGDILMTITGNVGRVIFLDESFGKGNINQHIARVRVNTDKVDTQYVFHFLSRPQIKKYFYSILTGQAYPQISLKQVRELPIYFPKTLEEQQAIAESLSDVDALIAELDALIEKKQQIKKGAMQQLLTPPKPGQAGKKRLPGFDGEWVEKTLEEIGNTYNGLSGKSGMDFGDGNRPYIPFLNVMNNPVIDTTKFDTVKIKPGESQSTAEKGDLFFNTSSETPEEVGMCSVLLEEVDNLHLNSFCFGFRLFNEKEVVPLFLAYYFRSQYGREHMKSLAQGSTRYNLSKSKFIKIKVALPSYEEQKAIAGILSDMDTEIQTLQAKRNKYLKVKQGMMQELLTGKTRLV